MKNIPDFELCKKLKEAGFPQPASKFGRFWYDCRTDQILVETASGTAKTDGPQSFCYYAQKDDHGKSFANEASFVYAPTISEMVAQMPHGTHFTLNTTTAPNAANLCAQIWLDLQAAKNEPKPTGPTVEDIVAALKFDADNAKPFYREERKRMADERAKQNELRAEAFKNRFDSGNKIICRLGGQKRGKIFELIVLGRSMDETYVKLQDENGNSFWKNIDDVEVVSILGNYIKDGVKAVRFAAEDFFKAFNKRSGKHGVIRPTNETPTHTQINTPDGKGGYLFPNTSRKEVDEMFKVAGIELNSEKSNVEKILESLNSIEALIEKLKKMTEHNPIWPYSEVTTDRKGNTTCR